MTAVHLLAILVPVEYAFLAPICLGIAVVTSAAHREDMREIIRHTLRSWLLLVSGILLFMVGISYFVEWILPS